MMYQKIKYCLIILSLSIGYSCNTGSADRNNTGDPLAEIFRQINEEVTANSQAYEILKEATQLIGHRLTGTENGKKAEEYTYELFKNYGYNEVDYFPFKVVAWTRDTVSLKIDFGADLSSYLDVVSLAHSPVSADVSAPVVDLGNGLQEDFDQLEKDITGKIVLLNIGVDDDQLKNLHRSEKTALAIENGASGVIFINSAKGRILLTGTASVTGELIAAPTVCITYEDGAILRESLKKGAEHTAHIQMKNNSGIIEARNVIATLPGKSLKDEKIIIGGHLDSWDLATGAFDNGMGAFSIMDIARTFKTLGLQPKRSIQFVMFMGEEQGLLGSKAYVRSLLENGGLDQVRYYFNLDMRGNPSGFNFSGREKMKDFITGTGVKIAAVDPGFKNELSDRVSLHSDHQSFMIEGIPTMSITSNVDPAMYDCYHASCDNIDIIDEKDMVNNVRYIAMMLYALANADSIPAAKFNSEETKDFYIRNGLKEKLKIEKEWRWAE